MLRRAVVCAYAILAASIATSPAQEETPAPSAESASSPASSQESLAIDSEPPGEARSPNEEPERKPRVFDLMIGVTPDRHVKETDLYGRMAEDMEIMGRLIHAAVQNLYAAGAWKQLAAAHMQFGVAEEAFHRHHVWAAGASAAESRVTAPQSTGLPEFGWVFLLEAPLPAKPPEPDSSSTATMRPESEWERMQAQVRGRAAADVASIGCAACHTGAAESTGDPKFSSMTAYALRSTATRGVTEQYQAAWEQHAAAMKQHSARAGTPTKDELADRLIVLLAENGKHLRLADSANVAIAITFRPDPESDKQTSSAPASATKVVRGTWPIPFSATVPKSAVPSFMAQSSDANPYQPDGSAKSDQDAGAGADEQGWDAYYARFYVGLDRPTLSGLTNEEVQGDLHLRQGAISKALSSYFDALSDPLKQRFRTHSLRKLDWDKLGKSATADDLRILKKLSQAYIAKGDLDRAEHLIQLLKQRESSEAEGSNGPGKRESSPQNLPARLVISAKKADLDAVAAGKMSFQEFKTRVYSKFLEPAEAGAEPE